MKPTKIMKKAATRIKKAKEKMPIMRKHTKISQAEIKKMQAAQARALKKLAKGMEGMLLGMRPEDAFKTVALIKNAGVFDLFVALGKSTKLLTHLKKGKK